MGSTATTTTPLALPALQTSPRPKFIFFTDFDGTITQQDSNDFLTDNLGFGPVLRKKGNQDALFERRPFRDTFQEMMDSVRTPLDQCIATLLANIELDAGFREFYRWARRNNIPVVVLSGGMEPIIRALLVGFLGEEEAQGLRIVSNSVEPRREGGDVNEEAGWRIVFHDDRYGSLFF